jgi:hypothetical protein
VLLTAPLAALAMLAVCAVASLRAKDRWRPQLSRHFELHDRALREWIDGRSAVPSLMEVALLPLLLSQ